MDAVTAFASRFSAASVAERAASAATSLDDILLTLPAQKIFLFNAAHAHTKVRSPDGSAWIRPLGFFPTVQAARARGITLDAEDPGTELRMQPAGKVFLVGAQPYNDRPGAPDMPAREREQDKANAAVRRAIEKAQQQAREVQRRAEARVAGALDLSRMNPSSEKGALEPAVDTAADAPVFGPEPPPKEGPDADAPVFGPEPPPKVGPGEVPEEGPEPAKESGPEPAAPRRFEVKDISPAFEMRAQKFAVLAVLDDAEAAEVHAQRRRVWWKARCHVQRQAWCEDLAIKVPWEHTLADWLATHPPPEDAATCPPLFNDPALPEASRAWLAARDEALLEAEWLAAGLFLPHSFNYAAKVGGQLDQPPAPPLEEPTVLAVGAADTLQDAEELAKRAGASTELKHVDVFVCAMYEWGRLGSRHKATKKHGRQLDEVMPSLQAL